MSSINFLAKTNQVVSELFELAYRVPIGEFKQHCFELIARHLNIDSGVWITRTEQQVRFYEEDSFTFNLPEGFMEDYHHLSTVSQQVQQVFGVMLGNLDKTCDILDIVPEQEWLGSDMYKLYCHKYDLHHSLMTISVNPQSQVMNIITFARHDADHSFSEHDKLCKEFLVPNMIEALRINILSAFISLPNAMQANRAVLDGYGNIIEAEEPFLAALEQANLITSNKVQIDVSRGDESFSVSSLQFQVTNYSGLRFVEVQAIPLAERLGKRKLEICQWLIQGKSNKEIGNQLGITEATVKNHLKQIFKMLDVSSRQQAISYFNQQQKS
ncbi:LuxR C-terminal-related transcriptional regulator [uncultured Alteromonas sp.]|uniref:helix-turn-helix domain-containing protein n=1 Tax=uncultured Alteromonas sp. TaxID=179113 RepID=UPI0025E7E962|nr:LuxR C-terminal-related transcriptional regulator [uncultured Alteromonas sp.]